MKTSGGCHCGAVRYLVDGTPEHAALCHCTDCRRSAGAPMVAWTAIPEAALTITQGEVTTHNSSGASHRSFCPTCGTGLFFRNAENLPGIVDIQSATLDDPDVFPMQVHIQMAEQIGWMEQAHGLPAFARYPGMDDSGSAEQ